MNKVENNNIKTKSELTKEIKEVISHNHEIPQKDIKIKWLWDWVLTEYPTGLRAMAGKIEVSGIEFKTKIFCIYQERNKRWYMQED